MGTEFDGVVMPTDERTAAATAVPRPDSAR
jgi:hypothetical protein